MHNTETIVDEIMINTLMRVGRNHQEAEEYILAQKTYQEALKRQEKLSIVHPTEKYQSGMIEILNTMALLYVEQEMPNLAIEHYRKVITIGRISYRMNENSQYITVLAETYTHIANLHNEHYNEELAKYFYTEAIDSYKFLIETQNYSYHKITLLKIYQSLITIYEKEFLFNEAKDNYIKAIALSQLLIDSELEGYVLEKSNLHCDLASLYFFQNVFDLAKEHYEASLETLSSLEILDSDKEIETLAIIHNNLASIYAFEENYPKSLKHYKEALPHLTSLAEKNPTKFGQNVAILFKNLASVYFHEKNIEKAQFFHFKSMEIFKEFVEYNAEKYNMELALCIIDGVEYYQQHSLSLYKAESILRQYGWSKEAEMLLGRINSLRKDKVKERV